MSNLWNDSINSTTFSYGFAGFCGVIDLKSIRWINHFNGIPNHVRLSLKHYGCSGWCLFNIVYMKYWKTKFYEQLKTYTKNDVFFKKSWFLSMFCDIIGKMHPVKYRYGPDISSSAIKDLYLNHFVDNHNVLVLLVSRCEMCYILHFMMR